MTLVRKGASMAEKENDLFKKIGIDIEEE